MDIVDNLMYIIESPYRSFSEKAMYKIYKYIKQNTNITVLLNGEGSDEIFSGYNEHYNLFLLSLLLQGRFSKFKKEMKAILKRTGQSKKNLYRGIAIAFLDYKKLLNFVRIFKKDKFFKKNYLSVKPVFSNNPFRNSIILNRKYSALPEYLKYADKISMYFSLEVRVPFLDYRLVEKADQLKDDKLIKNGVTKYILREAMKGIVPRSVYERKDKKGFFTPFELWIKNDIGKVIEKEILEIKEKGLFSFINSDEIYYYYKNNGVDTKIWRIYCLSRWKKIWKVAN